MQWLLTRKVWLLNTRKVHLAHFLKKVDIVRFNSKPSICKKLDTNIFVSPFCFSHYYNLPYINSQLFKHYSLYNYTLYELLYA